MLLPYFRLLLQRAEVVFAPFLIVGFHGFYQAVVGQFKPVYAASFFGPHEVGVDKFIYDIIVQVFAVVYALLHLPTGILLGDELRAYPLTDSPLAGASLLRYVLHLLRIVAGEGLTYTVHWVNIGRGYGRCAIGLYLIPQFMAYHLQVHWLNIGAGLLYLAAVELLHLHLSQVIA